MLILGSLTVGDLDAILALSMWAKAATHRVLWLMVPNPAIEMLHVP